MTTEELADSIKRINSESDANRIKLMTLRAAFINLAQTFHEVLAIQETRAPYKHSNKSFQRCYDKACQSNMNVLRKLELE